MSYHADREKNLAMMLKTILPSLLWAVISKLPSTQYYRVLLIPIPNTDIIV